MAISWTDCSEIVAGLILQGRISEHAVRSSSFISPYDQIIKLKQAGIHRVEEIVEKVGFSPVEACLHAAESLNGTGELNWIQLLEKTSLYYDAGVKLEKISKRLQQGEEADWTQVSYYAGLLARQESSEFTPLSEIKENEMPYLETGWEALDEHLMGIPEVGLIVLGGAAGSGKTWFFNKLSSEFVKKHKNKMVAFFSLEMVLPEIKSRYENFNLSKEEMDRILINPHPVSVDEVIAKSARIDNLGLVGVDYADLLVQSEVSEQSMSYIYRVLMLGAKQLHCPILLIAQLNRLPGIPTPNMLRWTGLAEALGWSVWMILNPSIGWPSQQVFDEMEEYGLPQIKNTAFLLAWKMRGGFRAHVEDSPGAIMIPFRSDKGWGNKGKWFSLKKGNY